LNLKLITIFMLAIFPLITSAKTPWPKIVQDDYRQLCTNSLLSQKIESNKAELFCHCFAYGLSSEFGLEEYQIVREVQPNANGSEIERRLYRVMEKCANTLG